jgi:dihydroorotate dehydrogenase (NAD+) catalytic subunit
MSDVEAATTLNARHEQGSGPEIDLSVELAGIRLKNPILTASGTFGYGEEYSRVFDVGALGGIIVKATSLKPRAGNPPPRLVETAAGLLGSCGTQNVGLDVFISEKAPFVRSLGLPAFVNVVGDSAEEFALIVERLEQVKGLAGYELNVSCPNVKSGGMAFGVDPVAVSEIVRATKEVSARPIICKLTPNVTDIVSIALAAEEAGADALSLINAPLGIAIDCETRRPVLGNITGGLTGPAIKPIALRMVWQVCAAVNVPVIGVGGIAGWKDAAEFIIAGATAVEVGTAFFFNPLVGLEIISGLRDYLDRHGMTSLEQLRGSIELPTKQVRGNQV